MRYWEPVNGCLQEAGWMFGMVLVATLGGSALSHGREKLIIGFWIILIGMRINHDFCYISWDKTKKYFQTSNASPLSNFSTPKCIPRLLYQLYLPTRHSWSSRQTQGALYLSSGFSVGTPPVCVWEPTRSGWVRRYRSQLSHRIIFMVG